MARTGSNARRKPARRFEAVRADQVELLDSPVRQEIVDTLDGLGGEADVATVAAELGRPADGLYYHFELLARGGLLQRVAGDAGARRYRVGTRPGVALRLDFRGKGAQQRAIARVIDRMLQISRRDFHAALARAETVTEGEKRDLWAGRTKGWVDARGLAEINHHLAEIQLLLQGPRRPGQDRLVGVSFVLAPLQPKATRRRGSPRA